MQRHLGPCGPHLAGRLAMEEEVRAATVSSPWVVEKLKGGLLVGEVGDFSTNLLLPRHAHGRRKPGRRAQSSGCSGRVAGMASAVA